MRETGPSDQSPSGTAILMPGLLRMAEENRAVLTQMAQDHDVFVFTARSHARFLPHLGPVKAAAFVEDDPLQADLERSLLAVPEGVKLLQWQKLYCAWQLMKAEEARRGRPYARVYKTRTDFTYHFPFDLPEESPGDVMTMQGDLIFGGRRDTVEKVVDFIFAAMVSYYGNSGYQRINARNLHLCDNQAGRFFHLKWPREIFRKPLFGKSLDKAAMWDAILRRADYIDGLEPGKAEPYFKKKSWQNRKFRSQSSFLHYVLSKDIVVKSISQQRYKLIPNRTRDN